MGRITYLVDQPGTLPPGVLFVLQEISFFFRVQPVLGVPSLQSFALFSRSPAFFRALVLDLFELRILGHSLIDYRPPNTVELFHIVSADKSSLIISQATFLLVGLLWSVPPDHPTRRSGSRSPSMAAAARAAAAAVRSAPPPPPVDEGRCRRRH